MDLEKMTAEERLIAEQAVLNFRSLNKACDDARDGTVLAVAERLALIQGRKSRVLMTSSGEVCLSRVYFRCVACGDGGFAADLRLGIHSRYSVEAERLVCLAAASWSYDVSSDRLEEFCGLKIGDTATRHCKSCPDPCNSPRDAGLLQL